MVVCESVPTRVSGYSSVAVVPDDLGEVFEVDLVDDAGRGRHDAEVVERRCWPHFRNS